MEEETRIRAPLLLTVPEIHKKTGLSIYMIRRMIEEEKVVTIRLGRKIFVNYDSMIRFLNGETS